MHKTRPDPAVSLRPSASGHERKFGAGTAPPQSSKAVISPAALTARAQWPAWVGIRIEDSTPKPIALNISQDMLANIVGTTRPRINLFMKKL
jgi:hypothetical protein